MAISDAQQKDWLKLNRNYEFVTTVPYFAGESCTTAEYRGYFILGGKTFLVLFATNKRKKKSSAVEFAVQAEHVVYATPIEEPVA